MPRTPVERISPKVILSSAKSVDHLVWPSAQLNQTETGAEAVAQRETTAPPSYGTRSMMQSHFQISPSADSQDARRSSRNGRSEAIVKALDAFGVRRYLAFIDL